MLKLLTCFQGHSWEVPQASDNGVSPDAAACRCPVCGAPADELPLIDLAPSEITPVLSETEHPSAKASPLLDAKGDPIVSGYEILEALGKNRKGVAVYRAKQILINRLVLLKVVLAKDDAGQVAWGALRGEANALAKIAHPNIPRVYEVGERGRQLFYNVVEWSEGVPLSERLQNKPIPPRQAAQFVEKVARAIHVAHEKGVVHRNLKPGSLRVETANGQRLDECAFKIDDFGLAARPIDGDANDLELQGKLPHYLSPEQAWGYSKDIGPCSDVYALGALLYELLTGRPPYRGERPSEIIEQIRSRPPSPPRFVNPKVPGDLDAICRKCLQKPPRKRYATALALAEDLRRYQESRPVEAHDNGLVTRLFLWTRRRPALACNVLLLFLLFVATLVAFAIGMNLGDDSASRAKTLKQVALVNGEASAARTERDKAREAERLATYYHDIARADNAVKESRFGEALAILNACPPILRGWEWHHLESLARRAGPQKTLASSQTITCIAFNLDGKLLAVGTESKGQEHGSAMVWATWGKAGPITQGIDGSISDVAFSPNGNSRLAVLSVPPRDAIGGGKLQFFRTDVPDFRDIRPQIDLPRRADWDLLSQKDLPRFGRTLAFSPDGRYLAVAGDDGGLWLFNEMTALPEVNSPATKSLLVLRPKALRVAFTFDSQRLVYGHENSTEVTIVNCPFGQTVGMVRHPPGKGVTTLSLAPYGRLAVGWQNGDVTIWDAALVERKLLSSFAKGTSRVLFSRDGTRLFALGIGADDKPLLRCYDGNSGREILAISGLATKINAIALDEKGRQLAVASPAEVKIYGGPVNP